MLSSTPKRHRCLTCNVPLHRHGDRRYRCPRCGATMRVRQRKRGPKQKQGTSTDTAHFYLRGKFTVRDAADFLGVSYGTAHERIRRGVGRFLSSTDETGFRWNCKKVTLIVDALWLWCGGERWTVYFVLARHVGESEARIVVCGGYPGSESYLGWRKALTAVPVSIRHVVIAVTSDGHAGLQLAARDSCPKAIHQRCQFHVLADFRRRLGIRSIATDQDTKRCWETASPSSQTKLNT